MADNHLNEGQRENSEFTEWWNRVQACPEHNLITENAAHAAWQERARRARTAADGAALDLPPIERDERMDRTYIPLPGGWEIQTKGKGSTFRIAHAGSRTRWMVLDDNLHEVLEAMARDMRNAIAHYQRKQAGEAGKPVYQYKCLASTSNVFIDTDWNSYEWHRMHGFETRLLYSAGQSGEQPTKGESNGR